jgi:hypothetical protein
MLETATTGEAFSTYFTSKIWEDSDPGDGGHIMNCTGLPSSLLKGWESNTEKSLERECTTSLESFFLKEGLGMELGPGLESREA